ncbi:MAG: fibronectin type III domain-containing protein [Candidatus Daviesbacteria bacterium]|nr:fibronectin type III domain-containing protein [Candidatus Daviesbacteria bacterium]
MRRTVLKIILGFLCLIFIILVLLYALKLIEPSSPVLNLLTTNITDHQVSISWTTDKPTKGLIVISENGKFPLLPTFAKITYKDDGEKNLKREGFYTTHHITVGKLDPNKTYQYLIYQGWKKMVGGSFMTGSALSSISAPDPVYGRVLGADKKTGVIGALVYFQASSSAVLSTLTNTQGGWSVDLGNLRTRDLKMIYPLASESGELLVVETGKGKFKAETTMGKDKPWPDIIVK